MDRLNALRRSPRDAWLLAGVLVLSVVPRIPTLGQPLLEKHDFRQTWAAWTALIYHQQGIDLLRPEVPIFGPPFVVVSEFPLFQALAALVMDVGVPADPAMRITGLATFVLATVAVWLLVRHIADATVALVAAALFAATPLALFWSRTAMIEYLALAAGLLYCWAGLRWRDGANVRWWALALFFGVISALVKPPTFVGCAIPLAVALSRTERRSIVGWLRARLDPRLIALGVVPVIVASGWLAYGDSLKVGTPAAFLLSSGAHWRDYYYGDIAQRTSPHFIGLVWGYLAPLLLPYGIGLVVLGLVAIPRAPRASAWIGIALAFIVPLEIFWGAYEKHDYYFIAISAPVAMVGARGVVTAVGWMRTRSLKLAVVAFALLVVVGDLVAERDYWSVMYQPQADPFGTLPAAARLARDTRPGEVVLQLGYDFNPARLYYARRDGLMLSGENIDDAFVRTLPRGPYRTLFATDPWTDWIWLARVWHYIGARESPLYRVADSPAGVADAYLVATDDDVPTASARVLSTRPQVVPCDFFGAAVPAGRTGTLLQLRSGYPFDGRVSVGFASGPVPLRQNVWLDGQFTQGVDTVAVTCSGAREIVIERVLDAPFPGR